MWPLNSFRMGLSQEVRWWELSSLTRDLPKGRGVGGGVINTLEQGDPDCFQVARHIDMPGGRCI